MKLVTIFKTTLIAMFAVAAVLPGMNTSAAIPCQELPVIEPEPDMVVPLIYIELPVSVEGALGRGMPADRTGSTVAGEDQAARVISATQNQFRCLGYNNDVSFIGNSTPQQRVLMFARPAIEADVEEYIQLDSLYLERLGDPIVLADGRYLIDFGIIVDGDTYLTGELVFTDEEDGLYLDGSALESDVELLDEPVTIDLSTRFTREVKIVTVTNADRIVFNNTEDEASADILIADANGEPVFEGHAMGNMLVGGENLNVFVVDTLAPGEYQITITYTPDDVTYNQTLIVEESGTATPVASPEASPQS